MRKTTIFLLLFCLTSVPILAQSSQPLLKRIILSQEEEFIGRALDFAITKEENIFLSDLRSQNIKLYDRSGKFIKSWKMRGQGPGEYQSVGKINFMDPYLGILDRPGFKLVIYRLKNTYEIEWVKNIQLRSQSLNNFQFYDNMAIIDGLVRDTTGQYWLQGYDLEEKKNSLFLPAAVRFGQLLEKGVLEQGGSYASFSRLWGPIYGYLDAYDGNIYSAWVGMSEIIKIDIETKNWLVFSHTTKNYTQPDKRKRSQKEKENWDHIKSVSWVQGVFADDNIVGLIYLTYDRKNSCYVPYLQTFNRNGVFQKEVILEGASGDYPKSYFPLKYSRYTGRLYVLLTNEEDAIFEILVYQIRD